MEKRPSNLPAEHRTHGGKVVVVEIVNFFVRIAAGARHGLRWQIAVAQVAGRRRRDLRSRTASTRSGQARIVDRRHAETVWPREGRRKTVVVTVLWWSSWLAAVMDVGRQPVYLLFFSARLQIDEFHFGFKTPTLFFQEFVLKLLFFKLTRS